MKGIADDQKMSVFPDQLMLYRPALETGRMRFVYLTVQPELFGEVVLVTESGWIGSAVRIVKHRFADEGRAVTALMDRARRLVRRGYVDRPRPRAAEVGEQE